MRRISRAILAIAAIAFVLTACAAPGLKISVLPGQSSRLFGAAIDRVAAERLAWAIFPMLLVSGMILVGFLINAGLQLLDRRRYRTEDRLARGLCIQCGYSLTGNASGVCPECGYKTPDYLLKDSVP